jgi:predicted transcriptional regulator
VKSFLVKDLMVPLSEYATVPEGSTLFEAVLALEKAQEEFDHTKYKHRAVLILDKENRVIGKLGHMDVLRALEPRMEDTGGIGHLQQFGFSQAFMSDLRRQQRMQAEPLSDLCEKAVKLKVEDFMQTTSELGDIDLEASLDLAIHKLVLGKHLSLLVTRETKVIGILRLADVFAFVYHSMKECSI